LAAKPTQKLITVSPDESMMQVIRLMKDKGISQAPVIHQGRFLGIVRELDLLNHMLMTGPQHSTDEKIGEMVQSNTLTVTPSIPLDQVLRLFISESDVVLVTAEDNPQEVIGIVTKIDVLDYVAHNCM
jgi:predicted transcriptional regulator